MTGIDINNRFLESYKLLERTLRTFLNQMTVLQYEDRLSEDKGNKLRICRQIRNFLQHNPGSQNFIRCSDEMCSFIENLAEEVANGQKSKIIELAPLSTATRLSDARVLIAKNNRTWLPVITGDGEYYGCLELLKLIHIYSSHSPNTKLSSVFTRDTLNSSEINVISLSDVENFEGREAIVVDSNNKYLGICK